jgi:hypothetical protein
MFKTLLMSAAAVGLMATASFAQTSTPSTPGTATPPATSTPSSPPAAAAPSSPSPMATAPSATMSSGSGVAASRITDLNLKNAQDETIGEIDDLLVSSDGKVTHVIISTGGVLGVGAKKVQVPWSDVKIDGNGEKATASMTAEQVKNAPEWKAPPRASASTPPPRERGPATSTGSTPPMGDRPASRP